MLLKDFRLFFKVDGILIFSIFRGLLDDTTLSVIGFVHELNQVNDPVGIAVLVVVPVRDIASVRAITLL